jgi:hypothetical protein
MTSHQERYDLGPFADFMAEDILSTPGDQLIDEVVEDCGDAEALASAFDRIVDAERPSRGDNQAELSTAPSRPRTRGAIPSSESLVSHWRRTLTVLGNLVFPNRLAMAVITTTCVALVALIVAMPLRNELEGALPITPPPPVATEPGPGASAIVASNDVERKAEEAAAAKRMAEAERQAAEAKRRADERLAGLEQKPVIPMIVPPRVTTVPGPASAPQPANANRSEPADPEIAELDRAIAANPNDVARRARRGQMFALHGNCGSAIKDFDEVIRLRPRGCRGLQQSLLCARHHRRSSVRA